MSSGTVEERLTKLEDQIERLQHLVERTASPTSSNDKRGWQAIVGTFTDDPAYDEAMRLGREWRQSQVEDTGQQTS